MGPLTLPVQRSASLHEAADAFLADVRAWMDCVLDAHPDGFHSDSHDGGTFMTPWAVYVRSTGDSRPVEFMRRYRDDSRARFEASRQWLHGYWRRQEAHHGTEDFDVFLRTLWALDPADAESVRQFEDAAEHGGNWAAGIPQWYDWERGVFRSFHLGTEFVGAPGPNVPEHMRLASLALTAHEMTGRRRYLDLAAAYGRRWAEALLASDGLPAGLDETGPVYAFGNGAPEYRSSLGAAPQDQRSVLSRAENLIASAVPDTLLRLWEAASDDRCREAATRVVDAAASVLECPIAWQAHAAVRRFRALTGSDRYDARVCRLAEAALRQPETLTIVPAAERGRDLCVMGARKDRPDWLDGSGRPAPSPLLWALCAEVTGDQAMLTRAVDLGRAYFLLARQAFGDVTHHGCGARSLSAVARGHGRLNGAGVVTEVLAPALEQLGRICYHRGCTC